MDESRIPSDRIHFLNKQYHSTYFDIGILAFQIPCWLVGWFFSWKDRMNMDMKSNIINMIPLDEH